MLSRQRVLAATAALIAATVTGCGSGPIVRVNAGGFDCSLGRKSGLLCAEKPKPTLPTLPTAPLGVSAMSGDGVAVVRWSAPRSLRASLGATKYIAAAQPGDRSCSTTSGTQCEIHGLTVGSRYTFTVRAMSQLGASVESPPTQPIQILSRPSPPQSLKVVASGGDAVFHWNEPTRSGGSLVTQYDVVDENLNVVCSADGKTSCRAPGAASTAHVYRARAANAVGASGLSSPVRLAAPMSGGPSAGGSTVAPTPAP